MVSSNIISALSCCVAAALAFPSIPDHGHGHGHGSGGEPPGHEFAPPGPFDSRSPCPGLNALANHGWLPRDGKNISYEILDYASSHGWNFAPGTYLPVFLQANETFHISTTGSSLTINLQDLARHDTIEADGSQSRNDIFFGDNLHFDASVFAPVAKDLGLDDESSGGYVSVATAAKARAARQVVAKSANPEFNASTAQAQGSYGTTALYLVTLWDSEAKAAPKPWVKAFFEEDRIAYREGYKAPEMKTFDQLQNMVAAVKNATV